MISTPAKPTRKESKPPLLGILFDAAIGADDAHLAVGAAGRAAQVVAEVAVARGNLALADHGTVIDQPDCSTTYAHVKS